VSGERIADVAARIDQALASLDTGAWDGASRARAEPLVAQVRPLAARLTDSLECLSRKLTNAAEVFEEEDGAAARHLNGISWIDWRGMDAAFARAGGRGDGNPDFDGVETASGAEYTLVEGIPFIQGRRDDGDIHPNDVVQGRLGDCYLMASMAVVAVQNPELIRRLIRDNGDGTYTVALFQQRHAMAFWEPEFAPAEVVVTPDFPTDDGFPIFAHPGDRSRQQHELWPMLVEKAYAQQQGSYDQIEGGWGAEAMGALTGVASEQVSPDAIDIADLAGYVENGYGITASSLADYRIPWDGETVWDIPDLTDSAPLFVDGVLAENHECHVVGADVDGGTVTLRNPWGWAYGETVLTFDEFQRVFRRVSLNPLVPSSE
jgi:uncharacterized protein YukE